MKVAISGSSGFLGKALVALFQDLDYEIIPLSRKDLYGSPQGLSRRIYGAKLVIHLAGASLMRRWTKAYMKKILDSRVLTTRNLVRAMELLEKRPEIFICASAVGIYPDKGIFTEKHTEIADDFLGLVCRNWETEASKTPEGIRTLIFRFSIILGRGGGALTKLSLPVRFFVGGRIGSGLQMISWIHLKDVLRAFLFVIENKELSGPVNICALRPVSNRELSKTIGKVLRRPVWLPIPKWVLWLVFREGRDMLTRGQQALPEKLNGTGFRFRFPELEEALRDLLSR